MEELEGKKVQAGTKAGEVDGRQGQQPEYVIGGGRGSDEYVKERRREYGGSAEDEIARQRAFEQQKEGKPPDPTQGPGGLL